MSQPSVDDANIFDIPFEPLAVMLGRRLPDPIRAQLAMVGDDTIVAFVRLGEAGLKVEVQRRPETTFQWLLLQLQTMSGQLLADRPRFPVPSPSRN